MSAVHIYAPPVTRHEIRAMWCPVCGGYANILIECWEWYSAQATCLCCGDSWSEGELMMRPFYHGWREERIEKAKRRIERYKTKEETT
jgi:hypothetical protein